MGAVRSLLLMGAVAAPLVALLGCLPQPSDPSPDSKGNPPSANVEVQVAVLLDLSGAQRSLGEPAMNGFKLALREHANESPALAATSVDTKTENDATKTAAEETVAKVACGAGFTNNESVLIAGPVYQQAGKPFLSIGATDPALPQVVGDKIFLACFGDNTQAAVAAEFAHGKFGDTTAVLWDSTTQYTRTLPQYFRTRFEELEGKVLLNESFEGNDLTELGKRIAALPTPPAFVYLAAMPAGVGESIASLRAAGVDAPIVGGDGLDTPNVLKSEAGPTSNVWFTTHAWLSAETGTEQAKQFVAAYEKAYGAPPGDAFAALGYDAANLLIDAAGRAEGTSPEEIAEALAATRNFEGVTGVISYTESRRVPNKTVWLINVTDGKQSLAESRVPKSVPPPLAEK